MKLKTRSQYSVLNMFTGVFGQIVTIVLGFVTRTVFIYTLGKSYLGISGLFSNILSVLNLTELGLGTAIVYSLYKPIAENDEEKILAIMTLYKKAYRVIGLFITVAGVCIIPFLPYLTKGKGNIINVPIVFLLYLSQTVSSYLFFAYRRTLFSANQKQYVISTVSTIIRIIGSILEIVALVLFKNFYVYVALGVVTSIVTNLVLAFFSKKQFAFLNRKPTVKLTKQEISEIKKNVLGTSIYKVCGVVTNSTSNILISALINVDMVGIYSNYILFTSYIQTFLGLAFNGLSASIGNLYVTGTKEHNEFVFKCVNLLNFWLFGFCSIAFYALVDPFIIIWLRSSEYWLSSSTVFLMFVYLALVGLQYSVKNYRNACGLMAKGKYRPIATIIVNLAISILLGKLIGLNGIVLGSIIAHITTLFWYDPILIYREIFKKSPISYFVRYTFNLSLVIGIGLGLYYAFTFLPMTVGWFVLKVIIVLVVPNVVFFAIYFKTKEFLYLKDTVIRIVGKKIPFLRKK